MAGETLRVRIRREDVFVDVRGDANAVQTVLDRLVTDGYGRLLELFQSSGPMASPSPPETPATPLPAPARSMTFVVGSLRLPLSAREHGVDPDGGRNARNRLGELVGAFTAQGFDVQRWFDESLAAADDVLLLRVDVENADLAVDQHADVTIVSGGASESRLTVDASAPTATFHGMLRAGRFTGQSPTEHGAAHRLPLALAAVEPSVVTLRAPAIAFTISGDGAALTDGRIGGAADVDEFAAVIGAGLAARMSAHIAADPSSPTARQLATMFDIGGCQRSDGSPAQAGDGVIDPCEVLTNPIVQSLLTPDVRVGDLVGVSVGVGFEARAATF